MADSPLIAYYRGAGTDHAGRHLHDVLAWDDDALEQVHDYVQWVFPNTEPSRANAAAPLLTAADIAAFRGDRVLREALGAALDRMLAFYGLRRCEAAGTVSIEQADHWATRSAHWLQPFNHNHLRLTRIMKCLAALGRREDAEALQRVLLDLADRTHVRAVSRTTAKHWREATS